MKLGRLFCCALSAVLTLGAFAADKLAIAEPVNKGGMGAQEIEAVWSMLEATVDGGYELVSRSALKAMLTEIGLTTSSDLMNLNSTQKARLGELKTVKYLLIPTISKFGTRINFSLMVLDSSTGVIDPERKTSETFNSLDEMADKLKDTLAEIGLGAAAKKRGISAILTPIVSVPAPPHVGGDFNVLLEASLINSGVRLQNLQSVTRILRKNNIDDLFEVEPAMYRRVGELLRVDYLIQVNITRFSCDFNDVYIPVTRRTVRTCIGNIEGNIRIVSAQTGNLAGSIPFRLPVDFSEVPGTETWAPRDYGKFLIDQAINAVVPAVVARLK